MGLISRAIDKIVDPLPTSAKGILGLLIVIGFIYGIIHEGFLVPAPRALCSRLLRISN
jgi:hypothetical protein